MDPGFPVEQDGGAIITSFFENATPISLLKGRKSEVGKPKRRSADPNRQGDSFMF